MRRSRLALRCSGLLHSAALNRLLRHRSWAGLTGEGETSSAILIHGLSASRSHSIHAAPRDWEAETVRRWEERLDKHNLARSSGRRIGCSRLGFPGAYPNR